jgi:hypothetical protein
MAGRAVAERIILENQEMQTGETLAASRCEGTSAAREPEGSLQNRDSGCCEGQFNYGQQVVRT